MKGSIRLFGISGIGINIHITFLLLIFIVAPGGIKPLALLVGVFFFVTVHELCHSLAAKAFGIEVKEITLFPIGGVASMSRVPEKPMEEFLISLAGPLSNVAIVAALFYPMKVYFGDAVLFHDLSTATWPLTISYIYWINLILAIFNMIPAFPMDGGRILRSILASRLGWLNATKIAVSLGRVFAIIFAYLGIVRGNLILVLIAIFIYLAASNELAQVAIKEKLKKLKIHDILPSDFSVSGPDGEDGDRRDGDTKKIKER